MEELGKNISVPEGQNLVSFVVSWRLPENFFGDTKKKTLNWDHLEAYEGFQAKLEAQDACGLWNDIASNVRGRHKSAWRIFFCQMVLHYLMTTAQTEKLAA
jgi:hypothetical protein